MITIRPSSTRGLMEEPGLTARHSFSHGNRLDPTWHHFRALRNVREVVMEPGQASELHAHRDLEVLTWVESGRLTHEGAMGDTEHYTPGETEVMTAGIGLEHREFSTGETPLHLLQFALFPTRNGGPGGIRHCIPDPAARCQRLQLLAGPSPEEGGLYWQAPARLWVADLEEGQDLELTLGPGHAGWIQILEGRLDLGTRAIVKGDGAAVEDVPSLKVLATARTRFFFLDLD